MIKCISLVFLLFLSFKNNGQNFYVTARIEVPVGSKSFKLDLSNCDSLKIFHCPPTNNTNQYFENVYTDIALDNNQNIYSVSSWGSLYKRSLTDTATCQFLGSFGNTINALVSDSTGVINAAGNQSGVCTLYKYSLGVFNTIGNFPNGYFSAGDLFFYEHRLFLTATNYNTTSSYLVEVNLPNPQQSCYYMSLLNLQPWAAFSVRNGSASKAFIITSNNYPLSSLCEIDIPNQTIGNIICTYPFIVEGAATYYNLTTSNVSCNTDPLSIFEAEFPVPFLTIQNPVSNLIRIQSNIKVNEIASVNLIDISGRIVKKYSKADFPTNLSTSDASTGTYIFQMTTEKGQIFSRKFIKSID